jgi:acyl carrier protein
MTNSSVQERVISIIAEQLSLNAADIQSSRTLVEDLEMDELDKIELILEIEEQFGIEISEEDSEKFITVQDIVSFLSHQNLRT